MTTEDETEMQREPWETTTRYGRADLTLHPVLRDCYRVACLIERCGASVELTCASSAAFDLCETVFDVLMGLCDAGVADEREVKRQRQVMSRAAGDIEYALAKINPEHDVARLLRETRESLTVLRESQP